MEILNGTGALGVAQAVATKAVPAGGRVVLTDNLPGFRAPEDPGRVLLRPLAGGGAADPGRHGLWFAAQSRSGCTDRRRDDPRGFGLSGLRGTRRWHLNAHEMATVAARAADDKVATDVVVLDVGDIIGITEAFVLASGSNTRQVRTICDEVELALKIEADLAPRSIEGLSDASWVLLDYGELVVHVFLAETRAFYDLERLWSDAPRIAWEPERRDVG